MKKRIHYIASICFGIAGVAVTILAVTNKNWILLGVAVILFILYYLAWLDFKDYC